MSFEFLNGTWSSFFAKANMTSLRDDKLLLMACIPTKSNLGNFHLGQTDYGIGNNL